MNFKAKYFILFFSLVYPISSRGQANVVKPEKLEISGYTPIFSEDGGTIIYIDNKSKKYHSFDIKSKKEVSLDIKAQGTLLNKTVGKNILVQDRKQNGQFVLLDIYSGSKKNYSLDTSVIVYPSEDLQSIIAIDNNNTKKEIKPFESRDYINVSLSPDQKRILFRSTGKGAFVIDFEGNIIASFTSAQFPTWVDNSTILFAEVKDDGHQYISAKLFFANVNSQEVIKIDLDHDIIPLFPSPSSNGSKIVFNTPDNQIYILRL